MSEKIPMKWVGRIEDPRATRHIVYESYKPQNLRTLQDYLRFVLEFRHILPNEWGRDSKRGSPVQSDCKRDVEQALGSGVVAQEIKEYYNSEVENTLPSAMGIVWRN